MVGVGVYVEVVQKVNPHPTSSGEKNTEEADEDEEIVKVQSWRNPSKVIHCGGKFQPIISLISVNTDRANMRENGRSHLVFHHKLESNLYGRICWHYDYNLFMRSFLIDTILNYIINIRIAFRIF